MTQNYCLTCHYRSAFYDTKHRGSICRILCRKVTKRTDACTRYLASENENKLKEHLTSDVTCDTINNHKTKDHNLWERRPDALQPNH